MTQMEFDMGRREDHPLFRELAPHIVADFLTYHQANPKVYDLFKVFAAELRQSGRDNYGAQAIMERIRWHMQVERRDADFKINNNHISCYTRLIMIEDKGYIGFFRRRHTPGTISDYNIRDYFKNMDR